MSSVQVPSAAKMTEWESTIGRRSPTIPGKFYPLADALGIGNVGGRFNALEGYKAGLGQTAYGPPNSDVIRVGAEALDKLAELAQIMRAAG